MNIQLEHLTKTFHSPGRKSSGEVVAVNDFTFEIPDGQLIGLLGPSGCGKSTTLNLICGLEQPTSGKIFFGDRDVTDLPPELRGVGMVFQNYALYPHLTVRKNILFPLENLKGKERLTKEEMARRVDQAAGLVQIQELMDRKPSELSGGQQQRVAIARALVKMPHVLLLDEPLSNLDARLRLQTREEIRKIQRSTKITTVFVTHDQEEALSMSDTVVVMSEGKIHQIGTPIDIYNEPQNAFVADFIGESNILDGTMLEDYKVSFSGQTFPCLDKDFGRNVPVDVVVRPEDVDIVPLEQGQLTGVVTSVTFMGVHYEIIVDVGGFKWMVQTTDFVDVDEHIGIVLEPDAIHIMKKSEYSNRYGDYSSFSNELEELSEIAEEEAE